MFSRLAIKAALFTVTAMGSLAGCGSPISIIDLWASTTKLGTALQQDWTLQFTNDNKLALKLVNTSTATSGQGAACVNTVSISGTSTTTQTELTVTAQSGTSVYERCQNPAENAGPITLSAANLAMFATDLSGPYTLTADQLTLSPPESGFGPGVLTRN